MRGNLFTYFSVITLFIGGCSTYTTGPMSTVFHNTTAHYNAYFIAKEHIKAIETTLYDDFQWNYNKVLPIYVPVDSTDTSRLSTQLKDCIEKASIAIQRHQGSKWEDDSYVLVGKARHYALEYADAIETYKYVNKKGEDDNARHEALIELIKTFVNFKEINNAIAVSDYLKKEKLNKANKRELNMVRAYLFQKREDMDQMVQNLVKAEDLMHNGPKKARISFIIGQVYQKLGFEAEAYGYYESCLKQNPSYELSFYTKLNMAQVTQLTSSGDIKKTRKYFKKLLRDPKNIEYKDKIYYEMASFELKQGNIDDAIVFYKKSIQSSVKNERQKAYSYLKLGQIYYDSLKNFELAQSYYDSTIATMPRDEEDYEKIKQRKEILDEFVEQIVIIRTNDSLIHLSQLPQDSLIALANNIMKEREAKEKERQKKEAAALIRSSNQVTAFDQNNGDLIGTGTASGATWYFYNPTAMARGASEFKRLWGNRLLEDNWRRSQKSDSEISDDEDLEQKKKEQAETSLEEKEDLRQQEIDNMLAQIPSDPDKVTGLLAKIEDAYYKLGNIYNFKLSEKPNAIHSFETLLSRFPETEYRAEVLYQLYLLYQESNPTLATVRANTLKAEFPDSIYAKLIDNPNYREESRALTQQLEKVYNKAYRLYGRNQFEESKHLVDSALNQAPDNDFSDNLALLAVLNSGKLNGQYKYQYELNNFIKSYPESELLSYAKTLVEASENYQINLYNSAKARFVEYFTQKHYLVVVYPNETEISQQIPAQVEEYIKLKNFGLTAGNLILDDQHAMVLLNDFPGKSSATKFLDMIDTELNLKDLHKGKKIYNFVITEDNFDIFYQTKDLSAYLNFFDKHYTK